jgi:hypothetical protein
MDVASLINKIPTPERSTFSNKVSQVASNIGVGFNDLMAIMDLESAGTFDPSIQNKLGYTGLIQFGDSAAKDLGTTTDALKRMTRVQQMDYVERYFKLWMKRLGVSKLKDFVDMYLIVFYPAGVKETNPAVPFSPANVEAANPALRDSQGHITKNSIRAAYEKRYHGLFDMISNATLATTNFASKNKG